MGRLVLPLMTLDNADSLLASAVLDTVNLINIIVGDSHFATNRLQNYKKEPTIMYRQRDFYFTFNFFKTPICYPHSFFFIAVFPDTPMSILDSAKMLS